MAEKILVVDDEREIADLVAYYLENENYTVYKYYDGSGALACVRDCEIDLAILDVMLPDVSGLEILKTIRENHTFPVIMLTAREAEIDKINGLTLGADDYVTKPFKPLEMVARVKAQLRRYTKYNAPTGAREDAVLTVRGLVLNRATRQCLLNERPLQLTPTEFNILWILCREPGRVVGTEDLFREVWGERYYSSANNTVMVHIRHLREKMNDSPERARYIKTVWGVGYKIEP